MTISIQLCDQFNPTTWPFQSNHVTISIQPRDQFNPTTWPFQSNHVTISIQPRNCLNSTTWPVSVHIRNYFTSIILLIYTLITTLLLNNLLSTFDHQVQCLSEYKIFTLTWFIWREVFTSQGAETSANFFLSQQRFNVSSIYQESYRVIKRILI